MATNLPSPHTTLVIILGASDFPEVKNWDPNPAFANSANDFREYLLASDGLGLPENNLLYLFDSLDGPSDQDRKIGSFLKNHSKDSPTDLVLYYVGHGDFSDDPDYRQFYLALRSTRDDNRDVSGYRMSSIARRLEETYRFKRRYLVLDCCYAGAAFKYFQSDGPHGAAEAQALDKLPERGTSLLCAASRRERAKAPPSLNYTMFSTALLNVLNNGDDQEGDMLSFKTVGNLCRHRIKSMFGKEAILPRVYSPYDKEGDVAEAGVLFPNAAKRLDVKLREIDRLKQQVAELLDNLEGQKEENKKLTAIVKTRQKETDESTNRLKDLEATNKELVTTINQLKNQLADPNKRTSQYIENRDLREYVENLEDIKERLTDVSSIDLSFANSAFDELTRMTEEPKSFEFEEEWGAIADLIMKASREMLVISETLRDERRASSKEKYSFLRMRFDATVECRKYLNYSLVYIEALP